MHLPFQCSSFPSCNQHLIFAADNSWWEQHADTHRWLVRKWNASYPIDQFLLDWSDWENSQIQVSSPSIHHRTTRMLGQTISIIILLKSDFLRSFYRRLRQTLSDLGIRIANSQVTLWTHCLCVSSISFFQLIQEIDLYEQVPAHISEYPSSMSWVDMHLRPSIILTGSSISVNSQYIFPGQGWLLGKNSFKTETEISEFTDFVKLNSVGFSGLTLYNVNFEIQFHTAYSLLKAFESVPHYLQGCPNVTCRYI